MRWLYGILIVVYVAQGHLYSRVWTSDLALWEHAARQAPLKPRPYVNLAKFLIETNHLDEAYRVTQYADALTFQEHVTDQERAVYQDILERNILLLSYAQELAGRGTR